MEETQNKSKLLFILLALIILVIIVLIITRVIIFNQDRTPADGFGIDIFIENVNVYNDSPNTKLLLEGEIYLSYDTSIYKGITLSGYCLGSNNEKYFIEGPGDGRTLFQNDDNTNLSLTEIVEQKIEYPDGTTKNWADVDWSQVTIKYCKIDKITSILQKSTDTPETMIEVEKKF